jgi:sarcosine oxidase/L-pipecolate oxidase
MSLHRCQYDVIVIGAGPVGLAAAYNCARAGRSTLVLERFNLFNQSGSSNDLVRMFRTMYTQDFMADLAKESIGLWRELEVDAGEQLILMTGLLNFGDPTYSSGPEGNLLDPIKNLDRLKMPYRVMSAKEIQAEYPFRGLPQSFQGVYAPDNGCIDVPLVLRSLYRLATDYGATIRPHCRVTELRVEPDRVIVATDTEGLRSVTASTCILAAGAYTNHVLATTGLELDLSIWEMVYEYYAASPGPGGTYFPSMWFQFLDPTVGDRSKSNLFYGFPTVPWGPPNLVRIAVDDAVNVITDPNQRQIAPAASDLSITAEFVGQYVVGVDQRPNFCGTCLQTNVCDNEYVLDTLPASAGDGHQNVAIFAAGWGFKMVPLLGRALSQLALEGRTDYDISHFKITRPHVLK